MVQKMADKTRKWTQLRDLQELSIKYTVSCVIFIAAKKQNGTKLATITIIEKLMYQYGCLQKEAVFNEEHRMELEKQLNTYMKSDNRLSKLKAVRLQNYWKKICEDEKKSQWRNDQLLRDFDRVEAHMADLHSRTEKLRTMKRQYEEHVERMYPDWKQRIFHFQRLKEREEQIERQQEAQQNRAAINSMNQQQPQQYVDASRLYSHLPTQHQESLQSGALTEQHMSAVSGSVLSQMPSQGAPSQGYRPHEDTASNLHVTTLTNYDHMTTKGQTSGGSTIQSLSTIPTGTGLSTGYSGQSVQATSTPHPGHQMEYRGGRVHAKIEEESFHSKQSPGQSGSNESRETSQTHTTQVTQKQVDTFMTENEQDSYGHGMDGVNVKPKNYKTPSPTRNRNHRPDNDITEIEEVSDFGSDPDIPLSARGHSPDHYSKPSSQHGRKTSLNKSPVGSRHGSKTSLNRSPQASHHGSRSSLNKSGSRHQEEEEPSIYIEAEITWNGLYSLLSAVSEQLRTTADKLIYRGDPPAKSVRDEIISNANRGHMLSYMDTTSLSMMICDQLPLLSAGTQEHCILHDNLLFKPMPVVTPTVIRSKIKPTLQGHWDKLNEHFSEVLKSRAMSPHELAEVFAPLMIAMDSPYETQAASLLTKLLEEILSEQGMNSPHSTSTFSATPRPKPMALQKAVESDEEDDIFDQEVPKQASTAGLTQSAAYRQVVGSTLGSTQKSVSYIDSGDEDDIENELISGKKKSSLSDSPSRKPSAIEEHQQRSMAGSFGGGPGSPPRLGSPTREGALSPASLGSGGMRSPSPLSGAGGIGGGYMPSGLGDTGRSAAGQSTLSSFASTGKKPAFMYGDSDTDEDIELPGTERNPRPEDDDFYS